MKKVFELFPVLMIFLFSILSAQEKVSTNKIDIIEKKELVEIQTSKELFAISKHKVIAAVINSESLYGTKVIRIFSHSKELYRIEEKKCKIFTLNFSNDGKWLSYGMKEQGKSTVIKLLNLGNGDLKTIENNDYDCGYLSFSQDSKKYVFARKTGKERRNYELVISDFERNQKTIIHNAFFPKWSPKGDKIAFCRAEQVPNSREWKGYIWIYNIENGYEKKLMKSKGMDRYTMQWSPDGSKIASHNGYNLGILNVDLDHRINIGTAEANEANWSPDGSMIAFIQPILNPNNNQIIENSEIFIVNADGTNLTNLTDTPKLIEDKVVWFNDKQLIVNISNDIKRMKIFELKLK